MPKERRAVRHRGRAGEKLPAAREWAILAGENGYTTGTFQKITGRPPRPVTEFNAVLTYG